MPSKRSGPPAVSGFSARPPSPPPPSPAPPPPSPPGPPSRIRILSALAVAPRSVSELAAHIQMEQPAVSQQLRILRDLELITGERKGRQVIYSLHDPHIADLLPHAIPHSA